MVRPALRLCFAFLYRQLVILFPHGSLLGGLRVDFVLLNEGGHGCFIELDQVVNAFDQVDHSCFGVLEFEPFVLAIKRYLYSDVAHVVLSHQHLCLLTDFMSFLLCKLFQFG